MNKQLTIEEILNKFPCVQCDGSGGIQIGEDEFEQCQFCYQLRLPYIADFKSAINNIVMDIIGEDKNAFYGSAGSITRFNIIDYRNSLRREQRNRAKQYGIGDK